MLSQTTKTSEGPAVIDSMPISPKTSFFAEATYEFPGPTILFTGLIDLVPYATAAIAEGPPIE